MYLKMTTIRSHPVSFNNFLQTAQTMIDSFQTGGANTRQSIPLPATTTPPPAAVAPLSSSTTLTSTITKQKATADFKAAREQYLCLESYRFSFPI